MKIYPATPIHLKQLNQLARTTYRQHFADLWSEQGLQSFLNQNFSLENLSESLRDPDQIWLLLDNEPADSIGCA